jgi:sterol desaturase/sphingolipid hydroxylase (fatty acid hydroxylase superfamily)
MGLFSFTQECLDAADGKIKVRPKGKRPLRLQVYENLFVEKWLAQAHPITPGIWFGWMVVYGLYVGTTRFPIWQGLFAFGAGVMITSLIEYFLHRFGFHVEPKSARGRLNHFLLHGYHHDFPNDPMRLVLPPLGIWPFTILVGTIYYFTFGGFFWPILGGSALGFIAYEWLHYATHHFNPKRGPLKWLKRYHMNHHFDSPHHRFGITSPLWDLVFGTYLSNSVSYSAQQKKRERASV